MLELQAIPVDQKERWVGAVQNHRTSPLSPLATTTKTDDTGKEALVLKSITSDRTGSLISISYLGQDRFTQDLFNYLLSCSLTRTRAQEPHLKQRMKRKGTIPIGSEGC